jgi:hypothetical protein
MSLRGLISDGDLLSYQLNSGTILQHATLVHWFKRYPAVGQDYSLWYVFSIECSDGTSYIRLYGDSTTWYLKYSKAGSVTTVSGVLSYTAGMWICACASWGRYLTLYVDGVEIGSSTELTSLITANNAVLYLGKASGAYPLIGVRDKLLIYPSELSVSDLQKMKDLRVYC